MSEREYKPPPAFQFYPADFMMGAAAMSPAERGAYIVLLCYQWNHGSIPCEPGKQRRIAGCKVSSMVLEKFPPDEQGELKNVRLELERQKQDAWREKCAAGGRKSGATRGARVVQLPFEGGGEVKGNSSVFSLQSSSSEEREGNARAPGPEADAIIPTLPEFLAAFANEMIPEDYLRHQFVKFEGPNLWLNKFDRLVNWRVIVRGRWVEDQATWGKTNGASRSDGALRVSHEKELDRVLERLQSIRSQYSGLQSWTAADKAESKQLKARRDELKKLLGVQV